LLHVRIFIYVLLLAAAAATAAEPDACRNRIATGLEDQLAESAAADDDSGPIELEAGELEAGIGDGASVSLSGGVILRRGNRLAGADSATIDEARRELDLAGNVRYEQPGTQIRADGAEFSYDSGRVRFRDAQFALANNARGAASDVLIEETGRLSLDDVRYTTCPPDSDDWLLKADDIDLDSREGVGTARGVELRFQGVPILYAPYLSFPISDARKTGILTPEIGTTARSGTEIRVPWYWNIAPNYDATITPRLLSDRGLQLQTGFRYLTQRNDGELNVQYLPNDSLIDDTRYLASLRHRTLFTERWRNRIDIRHVSDNQYFEDLGGSLSASSITHLNRSIVFDWFSTNLSFLARFQDYQTLDDVIPPSEEPYRRLPQLVMTGDWPKRLAGLTFGFDAEVVNFDRDVGVTGWRAHAAPRIELPFGGPGFFFTPGLEWNYTRYELDDVAPGADTSRDRSVPISSVDTGLVFERLITDEGKRRLQTIEPRILYVHIPFRDQADLPVFDTITPDLNLVQLFRKNRFLGPDRIGDTDKVSIGVTSRILDVSSGRELVTATIGQTRYFTDRLVTLPGEAPSFTESSDYIAEVRFLLYENLNFDFGHQWGTTGNGTTQSEARLQYRPSRNKILNLAYRFRRDSLEQGDISWSWPISSRWNFVGRYNYSFRDDEALEQFYGLEYESCCWGLRIVSRRHISTRDGTRDSSFGLQLVLKGMSSVGTAADRLLERGILGYSADLQ
jgi:LPS-assembly protein